MVHRSFLAGLILIAPLPLLAAETPQSGADAPMAVIDVHMHTPPAASRDEWHGAKGVAAWQKAMSDLNVRHAVLIGTPSQWEGGDHADPRFIPSLTFPCESGKMPNAGFQCFADGSAFPPVDQLRRWVAEGRVKALGELNAQYLGIAADDPRLEPYFALAEELDIPVGIHLGIGPPGVAYEGRPGFPPRKSPNYRAAAGNLHALEDVLVRHPKLRLYVMHAAWPMRDDMLYLLYMHPQLHVDVSVLQWVIPRAAYYSYLKDLVDAGFAKRIMFGSDGGVRHLEIGIKAITDAPFLSEADERAILHDNAARFFKLEADSNRP